MWWEKTLAWIKAHKALVSGVFALIVFFTLMLVISNRGGVIEGDWVLVEVKGDEQMNAMLADGNGQMVVLHFGSDRTMTMQQWIGGVLANEFPAAHYTIKGNVLDVNGSKVTVQLKGSVLTITSDGVSQIYNRK